MMIKDMKEKELGEKEMNEVTAGFIEQAGTENEFHRQLLELNAKIENDQPGAHTNGSW